MAKRKLTAKARASYTAKQLRGALKWVVLNGVAGFALEETSRVLGGVQLPTWAVLISGAVINILAFAIKQYLQGEDK